MPPSAAAAEELPVAQESMNIVFRGPFAPATFSPRWFRDVELIGEDEFNNAEIAIISQDQTSFSLGWLDVWVGIDGMQLQTTEVDEFPRLRDAAVGVLRCLENQPIAALGVNRELHMRVSSAEMMHHVGDTLAPKQPWDGVLDYPGVRSILMWGARKDGWRGRVNVRVEPSVVIHPAVFVQVNDHSELSRLDSNPSSREDAFLLGESVGDFTSEKRRNAIEYLSENWDAVGQRWQAIVNRVAEIAEES